MNSNAFRRTADVLTETNQGGQGPSGTGEGFRPRSVGRIPIGNDHTDLWLRMYTEEEVSELLQVSLSQLRKWRMKKNQRNLQGPPFKKIGRLVRYPGRSLQMYINGEDHPLE